MAQLQGKTGVVIEVWDVGTRKQRLTFPEAHEYNRNTGMPLMYSPDGSLLASGGVAPQLTVWDAQTGKTKFRLSHARSVRALDFSPDGKMLVASSLDSKVKLWDLAGKKELVTITTTAPVVALRFMPDGQRFADAVYQNTEVALRSAVTGEEQSAIKNAPTDGLLAFTPDGKVLATGKGKLLAVFETDTGRKLRDWPLDRPIYALAFAPDGQHLVVTSGPQLLIFRLPPGLNR